MKTDHQSQSAWKSMSSVPERAALKKNATTDVCIVGAGIAGLSCAYELARNGKKVIVLDDGPIAGGETERTTAHIVNALDDRYFDLEKMHGIEGSKLAAESHTSAIKTIEDIVKKEQIDCDFSRVPGYLFLPEGESDDVLKREEEAAHRAGLKGVKYLKKLPVDFFDFGPCLLFPDQGQFQPLAYMKGLASAIERMGGVIHNGTHVTKIEGGSPVKVSANDVTVEAEHVIVATNAPITGGYPVYTKQAAYRTYVIALKIPKDSIPKILFWDTPDPYHYVRVTDVPSASHDLLIVGGEDHKTGQANDAPLRYQHLERWARHHFPMSLDSECQWSGQVMEPVDGVAMIGRNPHDNENIFIATGDSGNGMTHGTIAGLLITDLIFEKKNPWEDLYSPARFPQNLRTYAKEGINVAECFTELVTGGDAKDTVRIPLDSGTVIRRGMHKIAAYKDAKGNVHELSAVCPHLGCIVHWNSAEKSWDCPCHGSRFEPLGNVVNGPAIRGMKTV